jgi:Niemann-Pick C1 protein
LLIFPQKQKNKTGAAYDCDQELRPHPAAISSVYDDEESGYFERLGAKTEIFLENFFTKWGTFCAKYPWWVLLGGNLLVTLLFF